MYGRDPKHRSLAASLRRSRQVDLADPVDRSTLADPAHRAVLVRSVLKQSGLSRSVLVDDDDACTPPDPSAGDAIGSTVEMSSRRRGIGRRIALLALGAGVWLVVTASDGSVIGGKLGSDDGLSIERVALARILDGVVAHVEVEAIDASGDQGAEFGAGAGPSGRPPAAPSFIGRDDPMPGGTDLGSGPAAPTGPSADGGELIPAAGDGESSRDGDASADIGLAPTEGPTSPTGPGATVRPATTRSSTTGRPLTTRPPTTSRPPTSATTTGSPTVTTAAVTTSTTSTGPSSTAPSTVTTGAVTTGAVTTGAVTTASTTATTAASTTQPESSCVVTVSKVTQLRADHSGNSAVIGQAAPGTYDVLERHGAGWYRVAGGWLRDNKKVTPSGC